MATAVHSEAPEVIKDAIVATEPVAASQPLNAGHPTEQLEVQEAGPPSDGDHVYPTGAKLWLTTACLCLTNLIMGLDITIVSVAVPRLTDAFNTIDGIGWYSAAYGMTASAFVFFFGKLYQNFSTKAIYLTGLCIFAVGSLLCTVAPTSNAFIIGRAVSGLGMSAVGGGLLKILRDLFPLSKIALMSGIVGGCQGLGLVSAPIIGGGLIDAFSWRGCFGVNIPLSVLCIGFTAWGFESPRANPDAERTWREKIKHLDLISTILAVPSITSLLMALQWGGVRYGWKNWRIILLFVIFAVLFSGFCYYQYRQGDDATVPLRIIKQRSILGALIFTMCTNGILATTEYYMAIYFQGVRGLTPTKAGLLALPMIAGLLVTGFPASAAINAVGYFFPFTFATCILTPIASGLLTTVDLDGSLGKASALLGFLGMAIGAGVSSPSLAIQSTLAAKDVAIGGAVAMFAGGLGSAVWICISATMFTSRLNVEIHKHSPSTNTTALDSAGLTAIRNSIGGDKLHDLLSGYNQAVVETLYLPLGLSILTLVGALLMERKNLKEKKE